MTTDAPNGSIAPPQLHVLSYVGNWNSTSRGCRLAGLLALIYGIVCLTVLTPLTSRLGSATYNKAKEYSTIPVWMIGPAGVVLPPPAPRPAWYSPRVLRYAFGDVVMGSPMQSMALFLTIPGSLLLLFQSGIRRGKYKSLLAGGFLYGASVPLIAVITTAVCIAALAKAGVYYPGASDRRALGGLVAFPFGVLLALAFKDLCVLCFWSARHFGTEQPKRDFFSGQVVTKGD